MTAALEGGEWSAARPGRTLPPGKTRYPFYRRRGGPHGRSGLAENLVPTGIRSRTVQPLVNRYTDWVTGPTDMSSGNISWGGKGGRLRRFDSLTTLPIVLISGSLKLLEPSGPVEVCSGIALPFTFTLLHWCLIMHNVKFVWSLAVAATGWKPSIPEERRSHCLSCI